MSLYIMSQNFGQCPFWLEKKQVKCCTGEHESVHISVIARVRNNESTFQSFLHAFRGGGGPGAGGVRNGEVSVQRESIVHLEM